MRRGVEINDDSGVCGAVAVVPHRLRRTEFPPCPAEIFGNMHPIASETGIDASFHLGIDGDGTAPAPAAGFKFGFQPLKRSLPGESAVAGDPDPEIHVRAIEGPGIEGIAPHRIADQKMRSPRPDPMGVADRKNLPEKTGGKGFRIVEGKVLPDFSAVEGGREAFIVVVNGKVRVDRGDGQISEAVGLPAVGVAEISFPVVQEEGLFGSVAVPDHLPSRAGEGGLPPGFSSVVGPPDAVHAARIAAHPSG